MSDIFSNTRSQSEDLPKFQGVLPTPQQDAHFMSLQGAQWATPPVPQPDRPNYHLANILRHLAYPDNPEYSNNLPNLGDNFPGPNTLVPNTCLLYTSPSPRDRQKSRMPSSA